MHLKQNQWRSSESAEETLDQIHLTCSTIRVGYKRRIVKIGKQCEIANWKENLSNASRGMESSKTGASKQREGSSYHRCKGTIVEKKLKNRCIWGARLSRGGSTVRLKSTGVIRSCGIVHALRKELLEMNLNYKSIRRGLVEKRIQEVNSNQEWVRLKDTKWEWTFEGNLREDTFIVLYLRRKGGDTFVGRVWREFEEGCVCEGLTVRINDHN